MWCRFVVRVLFVCLSAGSAAGPREGGWLAAACSGWPSLSSPTPVSLQVLPVRSEVFFRLQHILYCFQCNQCRALHLRSLDELDVFFLNVQRIYMPLILLELVPGKIR